MTEDHLLAGCLHSLAQSFEREEQEVTTSPDRITGWGQFLLASRAHSQTGLYGTGSGLLVRALAGRIDRDEPDPNARLLAKLYGERHNPKAKAAAYFTQTLRLAHLYLCVRIADVSPVAEIRTDIYESLMSRRLNDGLWGDWWLSDELRDRTPRLLTSAVVLLSCGLLGPQANAQADERLTVAAARLERRVLELDALPSAHIAVAAAALTCTVGHRVGREFSRLAVSVARTSPWRIVDQTIYFYEFREPNGETTKFGRDYFIIPPAHLLAIAGCQPTAPGPLRATTTQIVDELARNVQDNGGIFRTERADLVSTKNQAWAALAFAAAKNQEEGGATTSDQLAHRLMKRRTSRWNPVEIVRVVGLVWGTITLGTFAEGPLWKGVAAVCTLLLSEFYRIKSRIRGARW